MFPEVLDAVLGSSLLGKARERGLIATTTYPIRNHAKDKHRTVDDTPYGGGEGMLMKADVLYSAWCEASGWDPGAGVPSKPLPKTRTVLLSPQGQLFDTALAKELATYERLILVCGHYEGVDERFIELCVDQEVSIGNYVLTGGELPALVMIDAIARWVPGVVGNEQSVARDSLEGGLLKYPQYTRPREFMGQGVPEVLLSGDHQAIAAWREAQMKQRTAQKRPDLLTARPPRKS